MTAPTLQVHSLQSLGCVDGPGLRTVVFLQGCPLQCSYCHNPDTRPLAGGTTTAVKELLTRVQRFQPYFGRTGGVTISGGEPLCQAAALTDFLYLCKENDIHTAIDTAGAALTATVVGALEAADMLIVDVKHSDNRGYRELTGGNLHNVKRLLEWAQWQNKPLWVRQVIIPGITDDVAQIDALADLLAPLSVIERVELLPYHRMAEEKYRELGLRPPLADTPAADPDAVALLAQRLQQRKVPAHAPNLGAVADNSNRSTACGTAT